MAGGENLDVVLEFLRKNGFSESEAALRNELSKVNREELIVKEIGADESDPHPWNYNPTYDPEHPRAWGDSASSSSYESKKHREKKGVSSSNVMRDFGSFDAPRLPPVKLKSGGASSVGDGHGSGARFSSSASSFLLGSFPDVPVPEGKEVSSSGGKRTVGNSCLSVSRGIAEDTSDLVSGLATFGDEAVDYSNEYWDSDEYDDDDDAGYWRRPIEDESWFLAHEIDYPTDTEKEKGHSSIPGQQYNVSANDHFDNHHLTEEGSFFMGEQCFQAKDAGQAAHAFSDMSHRTDKNKLVVRYPGQLVDAEEQNLRNVEPVIQHLLPWSNTSGNGKGLIEYHRTLPNGFFISSDQHSSVRSYGDDINIDADIQRKMHQNLVGKSSEKDGEFFHMKDDDIICFTNYDGLENDRKLMIELDCDMDAIPTGKGFHPLISYNEYEFSFSTPSHAEDREGPECGQSLRADKVNAVGCSYADDCLHDICANDMLVTRRPESFNSSPVQSTRHERTTHALKLGNLVAPAISNNVCLERDAAKDFQDYKANNFREFDSNATLEYEELVAVQEQLRQIECQQQEFETFDLRIVHRKNRTGFEEDKNFHVVPNSVIAGRYHVTEYVGAAAFSKAIQAYDLQTGMDVCIKIIKNNKDFFDQSLDEIKLLKFVNKNDPADKYHILRLYDYFYFREHLLIVCELLKANLYEFHKFNRESGGEVYFTMPRLQAIAIQCLESLQFLHGLGLIHCDLKPENILVKSYSKCEVKIIDFGSSCFVTDNLCSYVQSRSYRAPEVILGLPYYNKIDVWSLGCILAELCTGNVLFQNDSLATLLARVIGIIGSIDQGMLAKGRDTHKYFSKNHMLYQKNQETNTLEYLIPKKTSLRHRLPMGDQGFIDFVAYLLEINPLRRPSASEALKHPWLHHPYEPISS